MSDVGYSLAAVAILGLGWFASWCCLRSERRTRDERAWFEVEQDQRRRDREIAESRRIGWRKG